MKRRPAKRPTRRPADRPAKTKQPKPAARPTRGPTATKATAEDLRALQAELEQAVEKSNVPRWSIDPDEARRSVAKLVLTLVDFVRQLLERQAIRRMDAGTLTPEQVEAIGKALMDLETTIHELARRFDLDPRDLNLDLGPLGRLT
jgi:hypothetical protein